jgi:prolipoprotein diacylglyceryltransferase
VNIPSSTAPRRGSRSRRRSADSATTSIRAVRRAHQPPWALQIDPAHRPAHYLAYSTFHPTFLYELLWDLALAGALAWLGLRRRIRPPGIFALYVTGYSAFRIFEETLRVDPAHHFLGER